MGAVPPRVEPFVFVVCGHNLPPGRFLRCLRSLQRQKLPADSEAPLTWGAVFIDDASRVDIAEFVAATAQEADRITLVQPRYPRGSLANHVLAIRHICRNPESVIVMVDMDDSLVGDEVLLELAKAHFDAGADVTVGKMLRTDKPEPRDYPAKLVHPRRERGAGNVWQHLKTFRRHHFMRISDDDLRSARDGRYFQRATDWAIMLPIVEMAQSPQELSRVVLSLPRPSGDQTELRDLREANAAEIMARPPYPSSRSEGYADRL